MIWDSPKIHLCKAVQEVVKAQGGRLVLHQLPQAEHNAPLLLFSALPEQVRYAVSHYRRRSPETSTLLDTLLTEEDM